jgi:hypothetical protein
MIVLSAITVGMTSDVAVAAGEQAVKSRAMPINVMNNLCVINLFLQEFPSSIIRHSREIRLANGGVLTIQMDSPQDGFAWASGRMSVSAGVHPEQDQDRTWIAPVSGSWILSIPVGVRA